MVSWPCKRCGFNKVTPLSKPCIRMQIGRNPRTKPLSQLEDTVGAYASDVRGQVRILATASVLAEFLAEDIATFLQMEPHRDIRVDLEERVSQDVVRGIKEGVASLGICWDAADFRGLATRAYRGDRLAVITAAGHALAQRDTLRFDETLDYEHVNMPAASAVLRLLQAAASRSGKVLRHRVTVSNFESVFRVVRAGLAISVAPLEIAAPYAQAHGLRVLPLSDPRSVRHFAICFNPERALAPAASLLLDHLATVGAAPAPA
ncbi:LysR substrate-binding domain protein [Bordetella hinzii L60]|nr:LysR substrate-binding domain protein [Bordetella hinzii L60]